MRNQAARRVAHWVKLQDVTPEDRFILFAEGLAEPVKVASWPASAKNDAMGLGAVVVDTAQDDCESREQPTSYRLVFEQNGAVLATHPLRMRPLSDHGYGNGVESPNVEGLVSQCMRHNEVLLSMHLQAQQQTLAQRDQVIGLLLQRLTLLEGERTQTLELQRDAMVAVSTATETDTDKEIALRRADKLNNALEMFLMHSIPKLVAAFEPKKDEPA